MIDPIADFLGVWSQTLNGCSVLLRIGISLILSAVIGCERASKRHSAGLRTFMTISLASTAAMLLDLFLMQNFGSTLFLLCAASILGVAVISVHSLFFSARNQIKGLTTAAALWTCSILGLCVGAGFYTVTLAAFFALLCDLFVFPVLEHFLKNRSNHFEVHLELRSSSSLQQFVSTIRRLGLKIDAIEANSAYAGSGLSVYSVAISISNRELKQYKTHTQIIEALQSLDYIYHIEEMLP